jgi:hypothetical protein
MLFLIFAMLPSYGGTSEQICAGVRAEYSSTCLLLLTKGACIVC